MSNDKCPIWGTPTLGYEVNGDVHIVNSPRTGGPYEITGTAIVLAQSLGVDEKTKLTGWLVDQRRFGDKRPRLDSRSVKLYSQGRKLSVQARRFTSENEMLAGRLSMMRTAERLMV